MGSICVHCYQESKGFDWTTLIAPIISLIVAIGAMIFSYRQFKKGIYAERQKEERQEIYKKLNDFYGPLIQLRQKSNLLYQQFSKEYRVIDPNFATLTYLLNGGKFDGNDKVLLEEILELGKKCETLIHSKAGLIDDSDLRNNIIPRATTHYLILRLAYNSKLQGEAEKFKDLTFPRNMDELLEKRKKTLELRLEELNKM